MSEWIKCSDQMPEDGTYVLVSTFRGRVITGAEWFAGQWIDRSGQLWKEIYSEPVIQWMSLSALQVIA